MRAANPARRAETPTATDTQATPLDKPAALRVKNMVERMFQKMDANGDGKLTIDEAEKFFKKFKTVTAKAMFNEVRRPWETWRRADEPPAALPRLRCRFLPEPRPGLQVDVDGNKEIPMEEWLMFWNNVLESGYTPDEVEAVSLHTAARAPRAAAEPIRRARRPLYAAQRPLPSQELETLIAGEAWVDWEDGRAT